METVSQLRDIADPRDQGRIAIKRFYRKISYYFLWVLVWLNLTGNQVSVLGVLFGLFAGILYTTNSSMIFILAAGISFLSEMMDYCDGEVARYRQNKKLPDELLRRYGGFFDWLNHLSLPIALLCMSIRFAQWHPYPLLMLFIGVVSALFCFADVGLFSLLNAVLKMLKVKKRFFPGRKSKIAGVIGRYFYNVLMFPFYIFTVSLIDVLFTTTFTFYLWIIYAITGPFLVMLNLISKQTKIDYRG